MAYSEPPNFTLAICKSLFRIYSQTLYCSLVWIAFDLILIERKDGATDVVLGDGIYISNNILIETCEK